MDKKHTFWTLFWVGLALLFNIFIFTSMGKEKGIQFFVGYVLEKGLSIDNLLLFFVIFATFKIPVDCQPKVLLFGVLGALLFRLIFILGGLKLLALFHWGIYIFGLFLVGTGVALILKKKNFKPEENFIFRWLCTKMPMTAHFHGDRFFLREKGKLRGTPLLLALVMIEVTDILFAIDSLPAIFAVTQDPFIIYTSNIFAILGLRSLYFVLEKRVSFMQQFRVPLGIILLILGAKLFFN